MDPAETLATRIVFQDVLFEIKEQNASHILLKQLQQLLGFQNIVNVFNDAILF